MSKLHLTWLGTPQVEHAGQAVHFRTRKTLALLIYLSVEGSMHSREFLAGLLWPESAPDAARASLRTNLLYLRKTLQSGHAPTAHPHLVVERDRLGFHIHAPYTLDLYRITGAIEQQDMVALQQELAHLRGTFLAGFSLDGAAPFAEWASMQREHWRLYIDKGFDHLTRQQMHQADNEQAQHYLSRWLAHSPVHEEAYRRLMQLQFQAGNRSGALQTFEQCREVLAEEVGVEPEPDTLALAERIRLATQPVSPIHRPATAAGLSGQPPELPFVGRAQEHAQLVALYHHMARGRAHLIAIEGEAGIGKSRLAQEFLAWIRGHGTPVLNGRAYETGGQLPYQPIVDMLRRQLEQVNAPDDLLADVWLTELGRILPELHERYPDLPQARGDGTTARTRLFEAVARLGSALSRQSPLVLLLDDVQWADVATLELLHYCCRRWVEEESPALIVICIRSEALSTIVGSAVSQLLREWRHSLGRDIPMTQLPLTALTAAETKQLVQTFVEGQTAAGPTKNRRPRLEEFGNWLYDETRGQPFYIDETLKVLVERGVRFDAAETETGVPLHTLQSFIPPGVQEIVRARLAQLPTVGFRLLGAAAVFGHGFDFNSMCRVANVPQEDGLEALDHLLGARLIVPSNHTLLSTATYLFTHDKIRDVVYTEIGDARRRLFHERAYTYLQQEDAVHSQLAHHALAAGLVQPAFLHAVSAGGDAMQVFAVRDAVEQFQLARQLLVEMPVLSDQIDLDQHRQLYEQVGRAYEFLNEWDAADEVYAEMLTYARKMAAPALERAALARLAGLAVQSYVDVEKAEPLLHEAIGVAQRSNDRYGEAETEWNLAHLNYHKLEYEISLQHAQRSLAMAHKLNDQDLIARNLNAMAYAKNSLACFDEAKAYALQAKAIYEQLGNRAMAADCLGVVAPIDIQMGQPQSALAAAQEAYDLSVSNENPWGQANGLYHLTVGWLEKGAYARAYATAEEAKRIARAADVHVLYAVSLVVSGMVWRALQRPKRAIAMHKEAMAIILTLRFPGRKAIVSTQLCADHAIAREWTAAAPYACRSVAALHQFGWIYLGLAYHYVAEALIQTDASEQAQAYVRQFEDLLGHSPRYRLVCRRAQSELAYHDHKLDQAIALLEEADALASTIGLPGEQWQVLARLAELHTAAGNRHQGETVRQAAAAILQQSAAEIDNTELRALFLAAPNVQRVLG